MIRVITKHAWKRLASRQKVTHRTRCFNKIREWSKDTPDNADIYRKGYKYIVRDGCLITMYYWGRGGVKQWEDDDRMVVVPVEVGK